MIKPDALENAIAEVSNIGIKSERPFPISVMDFFIFEEKKKKGWTRIYPNLIIRKNIGGRIFKQYKLNLVPPPIGKDTAYDVLRKMRFDELT